VCVDYAGVARCLEPDYKAKEEDKKKAEGYKVLEKNTDGDSFKVFYCLPGEKFDSEKEPKFCERTTNTPWDIRGGEERFNTKEKGCQCLNNGGNKMGICSMGHICRPENKNIKYCELKHANIECMTKDECKCPSGGSNSHQSWDQDRTICTRTGELTNLKGEYRSRNYIADGLSWDNLLTQPILSRADRVKGQVKIALEAAKNEKATDKLKTRRILQGF